MKVRFSPRARADIIAIRAYYGAIDSALGRRMAMRIVDAALKLEQHPSLGRPGRIAGTREWVIARTPYVMAFERSDEATTILFVRHAARRWPGRARRIHRRTDTSRSSNHSPISDYTPPPFVESAGERP
jgi:plasmid stabilization system protein ParE